MYVHMSPQRPKKVLDVQSRELQVLTSHQMRVNQTQVLYNVRCSEPLNLLSNPFYFFLKCVECLCSQAHMYVWV